jgi:hypothetical protein
MAPKKKVAGKRQAWNKGLEVGKRDGFTPAQVKQIRGLLTDRGAPGLRDLALFSTAIETCRVAMAQSAGQAGPLRCLYPGLDRVRAPAPRLPHVGTRQARAAAARRRLQGLRRHRKTAAFSSTSVPPRSFGRASRGATLSGHWRTRRVEAHRVEQVAPKSAIVASGTTS